jgi:hypothetical protein
MSTGRSEAHPPQKVKHDRRSNGRIILFMSASFAFGIESHCTVRRKVRRIALRFNEVASVFVRFDDVASFIVNESGTFYRSAERAVFPQ